MEDTQRGTMIQLRLVVEGTWADQKIKLTKRNVQKYIKLQFYKQNGSKLSKHYVLRVKNQDYYYPIHGHMKTT